ncbi:hypothetical protein [uncultured Sunxiuqinia sp.]|uniref:hypothetical protein n=1 Tax=uncultured Sunxiuqinia sp. TaxID=1573825 RepID=UPI002AA81A12|nr:hypothetical protein [uncultured Sunxiuqinia sp.]
MKNVISHNNTSFDFLKGSTEFLNLTLNNVSSCILLLDKNMELQAFNDSLRSIFSNRENEDLLYIRCGEAIGCAHNVEEMQRCGETNYCKSCSLRESAIISYYENKPIFKEKITRGFYNSKGTKELKHLQFSTRSFKFQEERYIIMIIDDITDLINTKEQVNTQESAIKELHAQLLKYKNID